MLGRPDRNGWSPAMADDVACWPMPQLALPFRPDMHAAVDGCGCRLSSRPLP
jgi:hypothetical protein